MTFLQGDGGYGRTERWFGDGSEEWRELFLWRLEESVYFLGNVYLCARICTFINIGMIFVSIGPTEVRYSATPSKIWSCLFSNLIRPFHISFQAHVQVGPSKQGEPTKSYRNAQTESHPPGCPALKNNQKPWTQPSLQSFKRRLPTVLVGPSSLEYYVCSRVTSTRYRWQGYCAS